MAKRDDPFELEEEERPRPRVPEGNGANEPDAAERTRPPPRARRGDADEPTVDERTVAERKGTAVPGVAGEVPPPSGWPLEALRFPLARPGPALIAGWSAVFALLDALAPTPLLFPALVVKVIVYLFLFGWFLHEAGMSAAGLDRPAGLVRDLGGERRGLQAFLRFLLVVPIALGPGGAAVLFGKVWAGVALLVLGSAWLSVAMLGFTVGEPLHRRPARAAAWLAKRPLACLGGSVGLWAAGLAEAAGFAFARKEVLVAAVLAFPVRLAFTYLWLVGARTIGVLGRAWTPWEE